MSRALLEKVDIKVAEQRRPSRAPLENWLPSELACVVCDYVYGRHPLRSSKKAWLAPKPATISWDASRRMTTETSIDYPYPVVKVSFQKGPRMTFLRYIEEFQELLYLHLHPIPLEAQSMWPLALRECGYSIFQLCSGMNLRESSFDHTWARFKHALPESSIPLDLTDDASSSEWLAVNEYPRTRGSLNQMTGLTEDDNYYGNAIEVMVALDEWSKRQNAALDKRTLTSKIGGYSISFDEKISKLFVCKPCCLKNDEPTVVRLFQWTVGSYQYYAVCCLEHPVDSVAILL